jgi:hypothetical protein
MSQRLFQVHGHSIDPDVLWPLMHSLDFTCQTLALYKHAADLRLIYADIFFNHHHHHHHHHAMNVTKLYVLRWLAISLEMADCFQEATNISDDMLNPTFRLVPDMNFPRQMIVTEASQCHKQAGNYIKAEALASN